jgi:surface polysaccharide O-acyltransferase-like enzyme
LNGVGKLRRFASIDFLRGLAIVMMIFLHVIMFALDSNYYLSDQMINNIGIVNFIALIMIATLGGMAGFFLLVSAIGNAISMERNYQAGKSPGDVAIKQIIGGALLLMFSILTEGIIGYMGYLGNILQNDPTLTINVDNCPQTPW